ncbi:MAG TPA: B12-binding domain-containing radical SAM protein [Gammaproteobacteria bacterium]|nr:B12-binding domain-containing radical SAM protein [Gammaproteobacteria bacterium]
MSSKKEIDVLIVRAPEHNYEYLQWNEDINAAYLLSIFRTAGVSVDVHDFALRSLNSKVNCNDLILQYLPKIVLWVMDKHPTNNPFHVSEIIREYSAKLTGIRPHLTIYGNTQVGPTRFLNELPIDSIILGEEYDALSLVQTILASEPLSKATGVAYRSPDGLITKQASPRPDLDTLPWPTRYFFEQKEVSGKAEDYVGAVLASRGCYAKCTFCYLRTKENTHGEYSWQGRQPSDVVDEIEYLHRQHGVKEIAFVDTQFFGPGKRGQEQAIELGNELISRRLEDISFSIYARANDIEEESIKILKKAGLYAVFIGIESFSQSVLDRYNKGVTVQQNMKAIELLFKYGVRLRMGFITFDHETTFEEIEESTLELRRLCNIRGDLITQPVFFNASLTPLDNTPAGIAFKDNTKIPEIKTLAQAAPNLYSYRSKLSRGSKYAINKDIRVEILAEGVRMLAAEITQRSTFLEAKLANIMKCDGIQRNYNCSDIPPQSAMNWFDSLTSFAVGCISDMIQDIKTSNNICIEDKLNDMSFWIVSKCMDYDTEHFDYSILENSSPRYISVD